MSLKNYAKLRVSLLLNNKYKKLRMSLLLTDNKKTRRKLVCTYRIFDFFITLMSLLASILIGRRIHPKIQLVSSLVYVAPFRAGTT